MQIQLTNKEAEILESILVQEMSLDIAHACHWEQFTDDQHAKNRAKYWIKRHNAVRKIKEKVTNEILYGGKK